ncbi:tRNA pseudouridine(65) synthase TruC [Shewanella inventionis]|uniref:tRNA pseudouridine synthase C n=2 Tax=Shewanella inventionis TaxID=1738770 RepID=A0ABQ1JBB2_9GAMM|nr:tRNA pseudouridine(65) synthase TruC [Shewanella inventionis]
MLLFLNPGENKMNANDSLIPQTIDNDELYDPHFVEEAEAQIECDAELDEQPPEIEVLFEDEYIVAIHKPAGLLVHRSYLARKERFFAMQMTRDLVGCHVFPVHRLDRPTSGVLLFAKSSEVARQLCEQFADHSIKKQYLAIVRGNMHESGTLDYALKQEFDDIGDKHVDPNKAAQEAVTDYQPLLNTEIPFSSGRYPSSRYGLVRLSPHTGRKHQLRRHMAHLRHPIVGDTTHGDGKQNKFFREHFAINRLWLIAKSLQFVHPVTQQPMHIETELEPEWLTIFKAFGWDDEQLSLMPSILLS